MSPPATLRVACIEKTNQLLRRGAWDGCEENPFSGVPVKIVQELLPRVMPAGSELNRAHITHSRLLLTSGRLENVDLTGRFKFLEDYVTLLRTFSRGCQNLRTLTALGGVVGRVVRNVNAGEEAFQELLQNCAKLEHLHAAVYFDPSALSNCRNLKTLRLHFDEKEAQKFSCRVTCDLIKCLRSLEVFALCRRPSSLTGEAEKLLNRATFQVLDNCPQLTSLGFLESSVALKEIHDLRTLGAPRRFRLRKCYWNDKGVSASGFEYRDRIRVAAQSCPMLEVLGIEVRYAGVLRHLRALRSLTSLILDIVSFEDDYRQEFCSLLGDIGPQLRHLSISGYQDTRLNVSVICRSCPNLKTLQLKYAAIVVDEGSKPSANLLNLERLSVEGEIEDDVNRETLMLLLSGCVRLKVLFLNYCRGLEDAAMRTILQKNPFAELEVALILRCSLSEWGLRSFLLSAVELKRCCIRSGFLNRDEVMQCVLDLNPSVVFHQSYECYGHQKEQFPLHMDSECWL